MTNKTREQSVEGKITMAAAVAISMNEVGYLLSRTFSSMSLEEKVEVKRLRPNHSNDVQITQRDKLQNREFCVTWFQRKDWLMTSVSRN